MPSPSADPGGPADPVDPADAVAGTLLHWNLAGWARHRGRPEVARLFADVVLAAPRSPLAVTANEVCSGQFDALAEALAPGGFAAAAAWSIPDFGMPGCASYGNAVFWRGGDGGVERIAYPDRLQQQGADTRERRTLLVATAARPSLRIATTHPAPDRRVAARQVAYATDLLSRDADRPCVLAADLNLSPRDAALDALYASHEEADRFPRRFPRPTHQGLRKLDYVFAPRDLVRFVSRLRISFRPAWSDHARLAVDLGLADGVADTDHRTGDPERVIRPDPSG